MTKIERLQKRIALAVARADALGYTLIVRQRYGVDYRPDVGWFPDASDEPGVCICGAIALAENPKDGRGILKAIAQKYGICLIGGRPVICCFLTHATELGVSRARMSVGVTSAEEPSVIESAFEGWVNGERQESGAAERREAARLDCIAFLAEHGMTPEGREVHTSEKEEVHV